MTDYGKTDENISLKFHGVKIIWSLKSLWWLIMEIFSNLDGFHTTIPTITKLGSLITTLTTTSTVQPIMGTSIRTITIMIGVYITSTITRTQLLYTSRHIFRSSRHHNGSWRCSKLSIYMPTIFTIIINIMMTTIIIVMITMIQDIAELSRWWKLVQLHRNWDDEPKLEILWRRCWTAIILSLSHLYPQVSL